MKRPTIMDIARHAGVSKGAVSYALRGQPGVSEATRRRILAIAEEMGWRPNSAARALSEARAGAFGLVLPRPARLLGVEPFWMELIAGVQAALEERSVALLLQVVGEQPDSALDVYRQWWGERRVDGVLLSDLRVHDKRVEPLRELGMPVVVVGGPLRDPAFPCVAVDNRTPMARAVEYLVALGHRRIARVAGIPEFQHTVERTEAFEGAVAAAGLTSTPRIDTDYSGDEGAAATRELLARADPPTGIIFDNDVMAVAAVGVAHEMGIQVPEELSVVAWDDSPLCQIVHPPLTTMSRDVYRSGALAASRLLNLVDGADVGDVEEPTPRLVVRASTAPPRA
ncbi:MAG: LacI family DNA-binding transcriptional regulator [Streptosporangiaceae bacterium]